MKLLFLLAVLTLLSPVHRPAAAGETPATVAAQTMVIVVRHAEKATDDPRDPSLSEVGKARAARLATALAAASVDAVYTTQYRRTRDTAAVTAAAAGVELHVHEATAQNTASYASELLAEIQARPAGDTVLVVGHSNTVPELVETFGGSRVAAIADDQYDRLFVITLGPSPRTVVLTY